MSIIPHCISHSELKTSLMNMLICSNACSIVCSGFTYPPDVSFPPGASTPPTGTIHTLPPGVTLPPGITLPPGLSMSFPVLVLMI